MADYFYYTIDNNYSNNLIKAKLLSREPNKQTPLKS